MKFDLKSTQGITLVSLVITIIILLILVGVAINLAVDSDGLFSKAGKAANDWNTAVGKEQIQLINLIDVAISQNKYMKNEYDNLKSTVEADVEKDTAESFNEELEKVKIDLGMGFSFGNELDYTHENNKKRRYKIKFSVGNNDTDYYYYETFFNQFGEIFNLENRKSPEMEFAEMKFKKVDGITITDTSEINYFKITVSNTYSEAQNRNFKLNMSHLALYDSNEENILNGNSLENEYTAKIVNNTANIVNFNISTTNSEFFGEKTKLCAAVKLTDFISDYKNRPTLIYQHTYNGEVATNEELQFLKEQGFKTIRIPITWYSHIDSTGTVDPEWFEEVNKVVQRVLSYGFYAIVDIHHDTGTEGWIKADEKSFKGDGLLKIKKASNDVKYLLNAGYKVKQATMFVANHYALTERERLVLARGVAADKDIDARKAKLSNLENLDTVYIDGFNAIIPMESLLSGSVLFKCQDGAVRDLANLRGSYKIIDKTEGAIRLILSKLDDLKVKKAIINLDKPVSNSGRLKTMILKVSNDFNIDVEVNLLDAVDKSLYGKENVISGDCIVMDNALSIVPLYSLILDSFKDKKWIVEL